MLQVITKWQARLLVLCLRDNKDTARSAGIRKLNTRTNHHGTRINRSWRFVIVLCGWVAAPSHADLEDLIESQKWDDIQVFVVVNNARTGLEETKKVEELGCGSSREILEFLVEKGGFSKETGVQAMGEVVKKLILCQPSDSFETNIVLHVYLKEKHWYDFIFDD